MQLLATSVSPHAVYAIAEADMARRIMFAANVTTGFRAL